MQAAEAALPPGRIQREERTCKQCRARKVRCDGKRPICSNCRRLGFGCSFQLSRDRDNDVNQGCQHPYKIRVTRACVMCRSLKSRCSGDTPACARCAGRGLICVYPQTGSKDRRSPTVAAQRSAQAGVEDLAEAANNCTSVPPVSPSSTVILSDTGAEPSRLDSSSILTDGRVKSSLERLFSYMHRLPSLAFLHRGSLLQLYRRGQADESLLLAIIAITSRIPGVDHSETTLGAQCADLAESLIMTNVARSSIFKTQALLLTVQYRLWTGAASTAFMLLALLARCAFVLGLHHESPHLSFFVRESRRRLMWAIYLVDMMMAGGLQDFTVCPSHNIRLHLPCREDEFELNFETETEELQHDNSRISSPILGMLAYHVRIIYLCDGIRRYTKQAVAWKVVDILSIPSTFATLEEQLDAFASKLPSAEVFSEKNLRLRTYSRALPRYVMTHIWWHQCHCDLFRCLIPDLQESFPRSTLAQLEPVFVMNGQSKCVKHARAIAEICALVLDLDCDVLILGIDMAECAAQAARILCCGWYMNIGGMMMPSLVKFTVQANSCLALIKRLREIYPAVSSIESDLENLIQSSQHASQSDSCSNERPVSSGQLGMSELLRKPSTLDRGNFPDDSYKLEIAVPNGPHSPAGERDTRPEIQPCQSYARIETEQHMVLDSNLGSPPDWWDEQSLLLRPWDTLGDDAAIQPLFNY